MSFEIEADGLDVARLRADVVAHGHRALQHDRTAVEVRGHEVHGCAGDLDPVLKRLTLGVDARKRGQERRVHVEDAIGKCLEQRGADEPHEARETHEGHAARRELAGEGAIEGVAAGKRAVIDDHRLDAGAARPLEPAGIGAIRNDDGDRRAQTAFGNRVDERLQVAATARDEHADPRAVR